MAAATRVKMSIESSDAFGYWRLSANGKVVIKDPNGIAGRSYRKCEYWIDGNETADKFNIFSLPATEASLLVIAKAKAESARTVSTTPAVDLVFCIDMTGSMGSWKTQV